MDNSEELKNLTFNNKFHAGKNHSESDVRLKRLSIIPEDETVDTDLRVVGFNVKVDGDKAYSFAVEKARSRSADTFTTLDSSNRLFGSNASASRRDECREVCDSTDKSSMKISCLPPMMGVGNENSQVCLCNSCYSRIQSVLDEKRKRILQQGSETASLQGGKFSGMVKEPLTSTSPKIKCKKFDYMSTDAWRLYEETQDDVLSGKIEATNIFHVGDSDSDESIESKEDIDLNSACEAVNDHLLNLRPVDKDTVRKAAEVLHKAWFETAASKHSDTEEVKYYLRYFEEFSNNLLRTLLYSVDNNSIKSSATRENDLEF